jgi:hypothetical protein
MQKLLAASLLGLLVWSAWFVYKPISVLLSEPQTVVSAQMRQVGGSTISSLLIAGWVENSQVSPSGQLKAWYRISNVGAEPIQDLKLSLHGSGFGPPTLEGCRTKKALSPVAGAIPLAEIEPGASCTLAVETGATAEAGEYMLTAAFSWTGPQHAPQFETLELGPVHVRSLQRERITGLLGLAVQMTPIFVPVSVALLGFWFQQRQQKFAHEGQAWTTMLPVHHENNSSLYLPLLSAIRSFRKNLPTPEGFFYLLLTIRLMRDVSNKGGFYLKDRKGEDLVSTLWSASVKDLREAFVPVEPLLATVDAIQPSDSFPRFQRKLARLGALKAAMPELEKKFGSWCLKKGGDSLFIFYEILHFEMNRIYFFWYGSEQALGLEKVRKLREELEESNLESSLKRSLSKWIDRRRSWRAMWCELWVQLRRKSPAKGVQPKAMQQNAAGEPKQESQGPATAGQSTEPKEEGRA